MAIRHAPMPWYQLTDKPDCIYGSNHEFVAICQHDDRDEADAALIVRAVNAHDDLVGALRTAIDAISAAPPESWGMTGGGSDEGAWPIQDELIHRLGHTLAKATGESVDD